MRLLGIIICLLAVSAYGAENRAKSWLKMNGNAIQRTGSPLMLHTIDIPGLAQLDLTKIDVTKALIKVSEVGADAVCFDLPGVSADGASINSDAVKRVVLFIDELCTRRMCGICRVFGSKPSSDMNVLNKTVETVAAALGNERRVVYWITGPKNAELAAAFCKAAPALIVAADANAPVTVVTAVPKQVDRCYLVAGAIPPSDVIEKMNFVMPDKPEVYPAFDKALADPVESKPWTPDNSMLSDAEKKDGFISLFNGKNLDGWWIIGENKNGFGVKDGTIEWQSKDGAALYTRDRYDNFCLRLEWKINKDGNSGVYIRAPRTNRQSMTGMEIQIQGDYGDPHVTNQTTCAVYAQIAPAKNASKPCGEWNIEEITVNGSKLKVVLNGETVQDTDLDQNENLKLRLRKGFIGLQDHATYVAFRNIRIKKL